MRKLEDQSCKVGKTDPVILCELITPCTDLHGYRLEIKDPNSVSVCRGNKTTSFKKLSEDKGYADKNYFYFSE